MKTLKITITSLLLITLANNVKAQATASATASATIVAPIAILNDQDMNFGNVAVSASPGTVILSNLGSRSATGGCTLPATTGTVDEAGFDISGQASYTYAVTLPSAAHTIVHTNNTDVMTVDNFNSVSSNGGYTLDGSGDDYIQIGATLNVAGSQLAGVYTSAVGFDVTVNYN